MPARGKDGNGPRERHDETTHVTLSLGTCSVHDGLERNRRVFKLRVVRESVGHFSSGQGVPDFIVDSGEFVVTTGSGFFENNLDWHT